MHLKVLWLTVHKIPKNYFNKKYTSHFASDLIKYNQQIIDPGCKTNVMNLSRQLSTCVKSKLDVLYELGLPYEGKTLRCSVWKYLEFVAEVPPMLLRMLRPLFSCSLPVIASLPHTSSPKTNLWDPNIYHASIILNFFLFPDTVHMKYSFLSSGSLS